MSVYYTSCHTERRQCSMDEVEKGKPRLKSQLCLLLDVDFGQITEFLLASVYSSVKGE